jgi:hypothetical protein
MVTPAPIDDFDAPRGPRETEPLVCSDEDPRRRFGEARSRWPLIGSTTLLVAGLCAAALVYARPTLLTRGGAAAEGPPSGCLAELELRDLPSPHEILLGLGRAPLATPPVPRGVRLELVALAPEHQPRRLIVAPDAPWKLGEDGIHKLELVVELEAGKAPEWPHAPAGEVGGTGPAGIVEFRATPSDAELWLVAAAGAIRVPCDEAARVLIVNPLKPEQQRRLSVEPALLRTAADTGKASLSVGP